MATGNLGGSTFTVTANTQPFQQGMQQAQAQAQRTSNAISASLNHGTRNAAMGFLELSRAIEDAQYGLRGVLNNIPTLVQHFGGGPGLAGAISIAAVAATQMYEHWNEMKATFSDTAPFEVAIGAIEMLKGAMGGEGAGAGALAGAKAGFFAALGGKGPNDDELRHAQEMDRRALEVERGKQAIEKFRTPEEMARAKEFQGALGAYGGPAKLMQEMVNEGLKPHQGKIAPEAMEALRKQLTENAILALQGAMQGKDVGNIFGKNMGMLMEGQRQGQIMKQFEAHERMASEAGMAQAKRDELEAKHWRDEIDHIQKQINLEKQRKREAEERRAQEDLNRMLRRDIRGPERGRRGDSGFIGAVEFHKEMQAGALNNARDRMLKVQEDQLKALNAIRQQLAENPLPQAVAGAGMVGALAVMGGPN